KDYFNVNDVQAVVVTHTVYVQCGIIVRIALSKGIDVYQVNDSGLYKVTKERPHAYYEFLDFKNTFNLLPLVEQERGLSWAEKRLKQRYAGEVGVDMSYSTKSAWSDAADNEYIQPSDRIKVFIATHCFFDSPHPFGVNIFPDFYEWLNFLGEVSERTDYDWYIKTHPDFLPGNIEILNQIISKYSKIKLLPSNYSHHVIIKNGINFVLTVYGTVGMEYAYFGVPVINACILNPHSGFNFNLHPKTQDEYFEILLNLEKVKLQIDRKEILIYYYMKNMLYNESWMWNDNNHMLNFIGGLSGLKGSKLIEYFFIQENNAWSERCFQRAREFLDSKEYCWRSTELVKLGPSDGVS
ncbi:MAG: hypothetical protein ACXVCQ_19310, partial [Bacteriovorax sp.]